MITCNREEFTKRAVAGEKSAVISSRANPFNRPVPQKRLPLCYNLSGV